MQNFVDSLCQCFGTNMPPPESFPSGSHGSNHNAPASPEVKRRTRSLALQDKQWDALFTPGSRRNSGGAGGVSMEQAQAVAKAKLAAASRSSKHYSSNPDLPFSHKRKRSSGSRDDIFRSKSRMDSSGGQSFRRGSAISRFLSNHPVIMNSLCFATPVKDSSEDNAFTSRCVDGEKIDAQSVISAYEEDEDDNTMTSTVYYETTKLAGLRQTNPPMPLFNHFAVDEQDDIHQIVTSHSHSSARLRDMFQVPELQHQTSRNSIGMDAINLNEENTEMRESNHSSRRRRSTQMMDEDSIPPPVTDCSSDSRSSRSGGRSR